MAYGFDAPPVTRPAQRSGGGWKILLALAFAAAAIGFAGYLFFVPYQKLVQAVGTRTAELGEERAAGQELTAERDKLKGQIERRESEDQEKTAVADKHKAALTGLTEGLKTTLESFSAQVSNDGTRVKVTLPTKALFDTATTSAVSAGGLAGVRILAGVAGKAGAKRIEIRAPLSLAPVPRELQQFRNIGEFTMLRAARLLLAFADSEVPAEHLAIVGQPVPRPRGRKPRPGAPPEIVDFFVELD